MALTLMYITNRADIAQIAEDAGVDRIFVDMEAIGKSERQGGLDTVQSSHTVEDVARVRAVLTRAQLLVRCNPIHEAQEGYPCSAQEIDAIIAAGADVVMLPYFKSAAEVKTFLSLVGGRAKTSLLVETPEAVEAIDEILALPGIDEVHVGINDLCLGYGRSFMFELLCDGTVERLCRTFRKKGIPYGFGGIASVGSGLIPGEKIIREHYRLGSGAAILSRSFYNINRTDEFAQIKEYFDRGVAEIRACEKECEDGKIDLEDNQREICRMVAELKKR